MAQASQATTNCHGLATTPNDETVRPEPVEGWFDKLTTNGISL